MRDTPYYYLSTLPTESPVAQGAHSLAKLLSKSKNLSHRFLTASKKQRGQITLPSGPALWPDLKILARRGKRCQADFPEKEIFPRAGLDASSPGLQSGIFAPRSSGASSG